MTLEQHFGRWLFARMPIAPLLFDQLREEHAPYSPYVEAVR